MNIVIAGMRMLVAYRLLALFGLVSEMFMPADAYSPDAPLRLDSIQLLRILLMDPFIRRALVLAIVIPVIAAILARKLLASRINAR